MSDQTSRRKFLTYGSAIAGTSLLSSVTGAVSGSTVEPVRLRGTKDDPVTQREIIQARYKYLKEWMRKSGRRNSEERLISVATPRNYARKTAAYNFELAENGTPVEFQGEFMMEDEVSQATISSSGAEQSAVDQLHSKADKKAEEQAASVDTVSPADVEGQVTTAVDEEWKDTSYLLDSREGSVFYKPAGIINYRHQHRAKGGVQGITTEMDMKAGNMLGWSGGQPGENATFNNSVARTKHQWNRNRADYADRGPKGTEAGSVSKSINITLPIGGVSFGYSQPAMQIVDKSRERWQNYCKWEGDIAAGSKVGKTDAVYNPSSFFSVDEPVYRNKGYKAVSVTHYGRWFSQQWDVFDPGTAWNTSTTVDYTVGRI